MQTQLPGACAPYLIRAGSGQHVALGGQLISIIARPEDTGGLLEAAIISGGRGAGVVVHRHRQGHEVILLLDGALEMQIGGKRSRLAPGDFASVPPGTAHAYKMVGRINRFVQWSVGGFSSRQIAALGTPTNHTTHDESATTLVDLGQASSGLEDFEPVDPGPTQGVLAAAEEAPADALPYVLEYGAGERLLAADQVFTFLADRRHTGGEFIVLATVGPAGDRIPKHMHRKHTETFLCTHGRMTMWADGEEVALGPGDFLHIPVGTEHSYRLDASYTRFVGLLAPGLFEPFFRALCEPFKGHVNPPKPGPARFDRVMQQLGSLDLEFTEPPRPPGGH